MIVGLTLWPPPSFHYPKVFYPNVAPLCLSYSSNKGSKLQEQKNYWQSVKWSLTGQMPLMEWGLTWWQLMMVCPALAPSFISPSWLLAARSRMNFTGQAGVYEDLSVLTLARPRTWLSSHQHRVMFGVWTAKNEARDLSSPRLPSNITPKTDGYD